ncbi:MAG: DUF1697 domain-containing protein [Bacteroidales bacterium]|nr:DUF1697 domain-containing protein [Bacteroidales bacterium]
MESVRYAALLRGINVGGNNVIKMVDLKQCFVDMGFGNVRNYIQSGNIVFDAEQTNKVHLKSVIERNLYIRYGNEIRITLLSKQDMSDVIDHRPIGFGDKEDVYRYSVMFLMPFVSMEKVFANIQTKQGVDQIFRGVGCIYASRLRGFESKSHLIKISQTPFYKQMTIRNWGTTLQIAAML